MTTVEQQREQIRVAPEAPVVTPVVTTRDVLHRAADLLEEFGWCQKRERSGDNFCFAGAVHQAFDDFAVRAGSFGHDSTWSNVFGISWGAMVDWNDRPERTKAEVVARLREAAEASHE